MERKSQLNGWYFHSLFQRILVKMCVLEPASLQAFFDSFLPFQANAGKHQIGQ